MTAQVVPGKVTNYYPVRMLFCAYLEFVADAPDGFDVTIDRIGFYFLAQSADMHINDMSIPVIIIAPDFIHKHLAGVYAVGRTGEQGQDVELGRRQHHFDMIDFDAPRQQVNGEAGETQG